MQSMIHATDAVNYSFTLAVVVLVFRRCCINTALLLVFSCSISDFVLLMCIVHLTMILVLFILLFCSYCIKSYSQATWIWMLIYHALAIWEVNTLSKIVRHIANSCIIFKYSIKNKTLQIHNVQKKTLILRNYLRMIHLEVGLLWVKVIY